MRAILLSTILLLGCSPSIRTTTPRTGSMLPSVAEAIVSGAERELASLAEPHPLESPETLEEVLAILKADRVDLFAAGVARADALSEGEHRVEAQALAAQLELTWGESHRLVGRLLERRLSTIESQLREQEIRAIGGHREELAAQRRRLTPTLERSRALSEALIIVGERHIAEGASRSERLLASEPDHYLAHRLAADFHRLRNHWREFDASIATLSRLRPDSTGLKFLRGAAATNRFEDRALARRHLRAALDDDPEFTRAQVHLMTVQEDSSGLHAEFEALRRLSPNHAMVIWAGPLLVPSRQR